MRELLVGYHSISVMRPGGRDAELAEFGRKPGVVAGWVALEPNNNAITDGGAEVEAELQAVGKDKFGPVELGRIRSPTPS